MTVRDIIRNFLKRSNYDGLVNTDGECGCLLESLMPCEEYHADCQPGYRHWCEGNGECGGNSCSWDGSLHWYISVEKTFMRVQEVPEGIDEDSP